MSVIRFIQTTILFEICLESGLGNNLANNEIGSFKHIGIGCTFPIYYELVLQIVLYQDE